MTRQIRKSLVLVAMIATAVLLPRLVSSREVVGEVKPEHVREVKPEHVREVKPEHVREVKIVAKDMTYRVDGLNGINPTLRFSPGERVRLSLRNEDKGMLHDFGIPEWGIETGIVEWSTEKTVTFRVPDRKNGTAYVCNPHSAMMSGTIALDR
jgi:hypothetical protein